MKVLAFFLCGLPTCAVAQMDNTSDTALLVPYVVYDYQTYCTGAVCNQPEWATAYAGYFDATCRLNCLVLHDQPTLPWMAQPDSTSFHHQVTYAALLPWLVAGLEELKQSAVKP